MIQTPRLGILTFVLMFALPANAETDLSGTAAGDRLVEQYFQLQTELLSVDALDPDTTLDDWKSQRPERQRELREMLGLDPLPQRSPLSAKIIDRVDHGDYRLERLHFQPMPGLYVAANFYLPTEAGPPLPTILYACGHASRVVGDVSFGNKTAYQHHGIWFARNGYACLIIDTIQWGEFLGTHHGTYSQKQWWWNNRGYTPAGVEAWTCVRALDYLETRPEVDANRFGVTGRSGGGIYSWWVSAIDDRIKVAVPVAGITTLDDYVVGGCVEGHCDCMFMVNTYRWDYPMVAALVAPRPLLISNSDKDKIFPLEGVVELHRQVRDVYRLYGAGENLGLQITEGPHLDTQELRVHAFRWFNRFLKDDLSLIRTAAEPELQPEQLKVFEELPEDQRVTTIQDSFVASVSGDEFPTGEADLKLATKRWLQDLQTKSFAGWPADPCVPSLQTSLIGRHGNASVRCEVHQFTSQEPYRFPLYVLRAADATQPPTKIDFQVLNQSEWEQYAAEFQSLLETAGDNDSAGTPKLAARVARDPESAVVLFAPRGIGPTRWSQDVKTGDQILRRFMLLGQTADGMRIWDIRRCLRAIEDIPSLAGRPVNASGRGPSAAWLLFASLQETSISKMRLTDLPTTNREAISLLNISRFVEIPQVLLMASQQVETIELIHQSPIAEQWTDTLSATPLLSSVQVISPEPLNDQ